MAKVGPYRIERKLGSGGMGEVYLAHDERLDRHVAIKRLRPDREEPGARARLQREARALARLSHPSIVPIFDVLDFDDDHWLVMEFVDGLSLAELLQTQQLSLAEVLNYGRQVAEGLEAAHAQGIVHRDLKLENVMVADGRARILDFGLVRNLEYDEDTLTHSGAVLGTVRSMSPEQAQGLKVDFRSDLFSLGVLIFEMLSGRSPFQAGSSAETLMRIVNSPPEPLSPDVPSDLADLVEQLLAKVPELRPANAASVVRGLAEVDASNLMAGPLSEVQGETELSTVHRMQSGLHPNLESLDEIGWTRLKYPYQEGHIDRAIETFQRLTAVASDSARVHAGLARAYLFKFMEESGDRMWLDQAVSVGRHAVRLDGEDVQARVSLGWALLYRGESGEARDELARALELQPDSVDALLGMGNVYLNENRYRDAEALFLKALDEQANDPLALEFLGTLYFRENRFDDAEAIFRKSIVAAPQTSKGYRNLAGVFIARGELEEALEILARGIEIEPAVKLFLNQGTIFYYQGLYVQAANAYASALADPYGANHHATWGNFGDALRQIPHRRHEARDAFRQAIRLLKREIEGQNDWRRTLLALYHAKAGEKEQARREVEVVDSVDPRSLFRLAVTCELSDEREACFVFLGKALDAGFQVSEVEREPELLALRTDPRYFQIFEHDRDS